MNPYDRFRRPDFQASQNPEMPWLDMPVMEMPEEDPNMGTNMANVGSAFKQRFSKPGAPKPDLPVPDINVAEPPIPAPNIDFGAPALPKPAMDGAKFGGGMKSL